MAEQNQQDDKKTVVAFIVGLLIGGLLVWAFSGPVVDAPVETTSTDTEETTETTTETTSTEETETQTETAATETTRTLPKGEGSVSVSEVAAGSRVPLASANYPMSEGWIGVRSYQNDRLGSILGVVRFSESQGLVPQEIILQSPTRAGSQYAIVMFSENGDRQFSLANDVQVDQIFATFTAQ